jgi:hypothetical protein
VALPANEFASPGFDLRPLLPTRASFAYGFLPSNLFNAIIAKLVRLWTEGRGSGFD